MYKCSTDWSSTLLLSLQKLSTTYFRIWATWRNGENSICKHPNSVKTNGKVNKLHYLVKAHSTINIYVQLVIFRLTTVTLFNCMMQLNPHVKLSYLREKFRHPTGQYHAFLVTFKSRNNFQGLFKARQQYHAGSKSSLQQNHLGSFLTGGVG